MSANGGDPTRPDGAASREVTRQSEAWPGAAAPKSGASRESARPASARPASAQPAGAPSIQARPAPMRGGETNVADLGTSDTLIAEHGVATITADPTRTASPTAPPPRRRWWLVGGASVLGAAAVSVATVLTVSVEADHADIGVDVMRLPRGTTMVVTGHARSDLANQHAASRGQLTSWWAARACGGFDVARALELAAGGDLRAARSLGLDALSSPAALEKPLACGATLAEALGAGRVTEIAWMDGTTPRRVLGVWLDGAVTPSWAEKLHGVRRGRTWFTGDKADLKAFEASAEDTKPGVMQELVEATSKAPHAVLASAPPTVDLTLACLVAAPAGAPTAFLRHCFPARFGSENEALAVKLRGLSIARELPAETGRLRLELGFLAKDAAAANIVESSLRAFWAEMLAMVNHHEVELAKLAKAEPLARAHFDPWLRALRHTTLTRDGLHVRVVADTTLTEDELERVRAATKASKSSADVDTIVSALAAGKPLPLPALERILGPEVATWLSSHRATAADCAAIVAHAESLPVDEESFGLRFAIQTEWAKDRCEEHLLPASTRSCLLTAKDIATMRSCAQPVHPDLRAARALLSGRWRATEGNTSLHLDGARASFVLDGVESSGPWTLRSSGDESAVVALPVGHGQQDFVIERLEGDRIRLRRDAVSRILARTEAP